MTGEFRRLRRADGLLDEPVPGLGEGSEQAQVEVGRRRSATTEVRRCADDDQVDNAVGTESLSCELRCGPDGSLVIARHMCRLFELNLLLGARSVRVDDPQDAQ